MQKIGRYEILEELGRGSMGAVFKAKDPQIGRTVAIKIILTANLPKEDNDLYRMRFYREAQAAGQMSHPGIVTIHDIAEDDSGQPYLVMEYVEGQTMHKLLKPDQQGKVIERPPLETTLDLCAQVAEAMHYAHLRNVVHRDIKPSNIMVTPEGRAKITDFGIARLSGTEATHTASITGTPAYMSPEQFRGGTIDSRSDIFSLGSMLYWMSTGEKAFPGDNVTQVSFNVVYREPAPPRHLVEDLPESLSIVLSRCLAKRPENRYQTAGEVAYDLRAIAEGKLIAATTAPPELTVEDTVDTIQNVRPVGKPLAVAAEESAAGRRRKSSSKSSSLLWVAALVVVLAAGAWFWKQSQSNQSELASAPQQQTAGSANPSGGSGATAPGAAGSSSANTKAPSNAVVPPPPPDSATGAKQDASAAANPSATEKSAEPAPGGTAAPAKTSPAKRTPATISLGTGATLAIDCRHNFKTAQMEIQTGDFSVLRADLVGTNAGGRGGRLNQTITLRPGKYKFVVKVTAEEDRYIQTKAAAEVEFTKDQTRTLEITFGSFAGLGRRNLSLKWKK